MEVAKSTRDEKSVEEMGQHILALENEIAGLNNSTKKVIASRNMEIIKKTKENAELIYDLNSMRKECRKREGEINALNKIIENLRRTISSFEQDGK
jgi:SMC interacting uncharacterized protein involved in chromosome segregation